MDPPAHETTYPLGTPAPVRGPVERPCPAVAADCCGPRALFGWTPPPLPADTALQRRVAAPLRGSRGRLVIFFPVIRVRANWRACSPGPVARVVRRLATLA